MKRKKRIGTVGKAIGCLFFLMVSLFPIYWLVAMAIRPTDEMRGHIALIPQSLTGIHFAELFSAKNFGTAIINSLQTTFGSLFVSLVVGICAAYIIARRRFRFGLKKPMTYWVLLVRVLPPVAFTIPLYIMFKKIGLYNSPWAIVIIFTVIQSAFGTYLLSSVYGTFPKSILEAATIDGASRWTIFRKIVFPISKPTLSVMLVFFFIWTWNEYMIPMAFLIDNSTQTIPIAVSSLTGDRLMDVTTTAAASLISIVPTLIFYLIFQRTLSRGITAGAVK